MNIKFYKNIWYGVTFFIVILIVSIAIFSVKNNDIAILTSKKILYFDIEIIYRMIFNPLWAIALWTFNNGLKLNSKRHKDILLTIQGALDSHDEENIKIKKIYNIVFQYSDIEKRMNDKFVQNDLISDENNDPEI